MDFLNKIFELIPVLLKIGLAIGAILLWQELSKQPRKLAKARSSVVALRKPAKAKSSVVSPRLKNSLISRLQGDASTAARLVEHERSRLPGRTEAWYWSAALDRLMRDRNAI
ncbi:MAG: hypothetical protein F6K19_51140 [Cyanothece sp. SIO1E1]|nr:hypothetical protein [Cyanothece sp. SIO1E1]